MLSIVLLQIGCEMCASDGGRVCKRYVANAKLQEMQQQNEK